MNTVIRQRDIYERLPVGLILGFAGGFFNAYTFMARGGVFCNAQTGNLILMALGLAQGEGVNALKYLVPIAFFLLANILCEVAYRLSARAAKKRGLKDDGKFVYRSSILAAETLILIAVGFIPVTFPTLLPNALISFAAAMQFHTFRQTDDLTLSTVFCTNNLRLLSEHIFTAVADKSVASLKKAGVYFLIIAFFTGGVFGGYFLTDYASHYAIFAIAGAYLLMEIAILICKLIESKNQPQPEI